MYYNSNKQTNDYYNSYKREMQELEAYEKQGKVQQLMKIIFVITVLLLSVLSSYYLYKYFNPDIQTSHKIETTTLKQKSQLPTITIKEYKSNNYQISKATKQISLTLVFLELRGVVLRQTIAKSIRLFTYENWHLFNLHS